MTGATVAAPKDGTEGAEPNKLGAATLLATVEVKPKTPAVDAPPSKREVLVALPILLPAVDAPNENGAALLAGGAPPNEGTEGPEGADPNRLPAGAAALVATAGVDPKEPNGATPNVDVGAVALELAVLVLVAPIPVGPAGRVGAEVPPKLNPVVLTAGIVLVAVLATAAELAGAEVPLKLNPPGLAAGVTVLAVAPPKLNAPVLTGTADAA